MFGAVQLRVLAACVVFFVPIGMVSWHLNRNKMLFFSGALFITIAVGVPSHFLLPFNFYLCFLCSCTPNHDHCSICSISLQSPRDCIPC
ncbi:hypothetical protein CsSME_00036589 [Camellia sinensis var. sinensis]